jgi:hypothetical protein
MKFDWDKVSKIDIGDQKKPSDGWLISELTARLKGGMNFMAAVAGATGSGKSYTVLRICELLSKSLDAPFTIDNVVFDPQEFFDGLGSAQYYTCFMIDESGLSLDAHRWMSVINKLFGYVAETFRFKRLAVFFVMPDLSFLDSRCRRVTHAFIRVHQPYGREARVYKLASNHLGEQWLKGMGKLVNVKLPNYESCKKSKCGDCAKFSSTGPDRCYLLRANYERKKEEAFETLRLYIQMELSQRAGGKSPYGEMNQIDNGPNHTPVLPNLTSPPGPEPNLPFVSPEDLDQFDIDDYDINSKIDEYIKKHKTPKVGELNKSDWGKNVLNNNNVFDRVGVAEDIEPVIKRGRGRPRKFPRKDEKDEDKLKI